MSRSRFVVRFIDPRTTLARSALRSNSFEHSASPQRFPVADGARALQSVASVVPIFSIDFALRAGPNGCQLAIQDFEGDQSEVQEAQDKAVHEDFRTLYTSDVGRKALQNASSKR